MYRTLVHNHKTRKELTTLQDMLLVATGAGRLDTIGTIAAKQPLVVFGTMGGTDLSRLGNRSVGGNITPVYFYATG